MFTVSLSKKQIPNIVIFLSLSALLGLLKADPTAPKSLETAGFGEGAAGQGWVC